MPKYLSEMIQLGYDNQSSVALLWGMVENEEKQQEDQAISNNSYVYGDMSLLKNMSYRSSKLKTTTVSSWHV